MIDKQKLLENFSQCQNWEEKYLYIIELGNYLDLLPPDTRNECNLIYGCQSQVWIVSHYNNYKLKLYGDSDSLIVKGLIAILFILYQKLTLIEIIEFDVNIFFHKLELINFLTISRLQGIESIVKNIRTRISKLLED